jgi:hypothetical protein
VLNLAAADSGLASAQRRFFDETLPPSLSSAAFAAFDARPYDSETLTWGKEAWQLRTLDEYRSQVGFTELLMEVTELGCAFDTVTAAVRVVRDEARHVELCRRLVIALGGTDEIPGEPKYVRSDDSEPVHVRVVQSLAGSLCIGETLSTAILAATRKVTKDALAKEVITALTRDESFHGQLGWTLLPQLWPVLSVKEQRRVKARIKDDLQAAKEAVFEGCGHDDTEDARNPFGHLKNAERKVVFERALERDVLRRFRELGLQSAR